MRGHAEASMTLDTFADLFDEDLDGVADRLDTAIRTTADGSYTQGRAAHPDPRKFCGAKGIRTPGLSRQFTFLPAVAVRLVPIRSRSLPAVSSSVLDGVKSGHLHDAVG
jgi:hypothetical protein